jgi:hypothetical protein
MNDHPAVPAPQPAFIIRTGILYVPAWEWDTTYPTILGYPYEAHLPPHESHGWATLFFENDWNVNWNWRLHRPTRDWIEVWSHQRGNGLYFERARGIVGLNELLRRIAIVAGRESWKVDAA